MSQPKIALVTDSTNDIPRELIEKYQIAVVPLTIVWGGKTYLDGVDLTAGEFYQRLKTDPSHPTTSQPAPADFLRAYDNALENGAQEIITLTISGAMSGTLESARTAAQQAKLPVHLVDSRSNSMSLGWQVLASARARETGASVEEAIAAAEKVRSRVHFHVLLDTLEYLFKGGRIAGAAKLVNNVLKIKPQIRVNHESGSVEPVDISRTRQKGIDALFSNFFKRVDPTRPFRVAVMHNDAFDEAQELAARIQNMSTPMEIHIGIVSPVLGVHTGPRALGLSGYNED